MKFPDNFEFFDADNRASERGKVDQSLGSCIRSLTNQEKT